MRNLSETMCSKLKWFAPLVVLTLSGAAGAAEAGATDASAQTPICKDSGVSLTFAEGSAELDRNARGALTGVATWIGNGETRTVKLAGFADRKGNAEFNQRLSEQRAQAAKDFLVAHGASPEKVTIVGLGEEQNRHEASSEQRVVMVMATLLDPSLLIADEVTSALDVSTQRAVAESMVEFRDRGFVKSMMFVTHDISLVYQMADTIMVMYAGRVVESGPVRDIFDRPSHPYTQALLSSVPRMDEDVERLYSITGQPPALWDLPPGCRFAPRCPYADERCGREYPPSFPVGEGHHADCWRLAPA